MIRSVTKEDIPNIRKLMESEPGFWQESWRYDVLERGLDSAGGLAFVWEETGQILGFVCAHDLGFRGYLSELIVAKSARNRGIGKHLATGRAKACCSGLQHLDIRRLGRLS